MGKGQLTVVRVAAAVVCCNVACDVVNCLVVMVV